MLVQAAQHTMDQVDRLIEALAAHVTLGPVDHDTRGLADRLTTVLAAL